LLGHSGSPLRADSVAKVESCRLGIFREKTTQELIGDSCFMIQAAAKRLGASTRSSRDVAPSGA